jgi:hypothetical protein
MENNISSFPTRHILINTIPLYLKEILSKNINKKDLLGTEFTFVVDVSGDKYNYITYDGINIIYLESDIKKPMLRIKISRDNLERMIITANLDLLVGVHSDFKRSKLNIIQNLSGTMLVELQENDGTVFNFEMIFNDAEKPKSFFKMSTSDSCAMKRKERKPLDLYLLGNLKVEGDIFFALSVEPLFN